MKRIKGYLPGVILALMLLACSTTGNRPTPTSPPAPIVTPTPFPFRAGEYSGFCFPENDQAHQLFDQAFAAQDQGDFDSAEQLYLQAIDADPSLCDAMTNLGWLFFIQGDVETAVDWLERAIAVSPQDPFAYQNLGSLYVDEGRYEEAEAVFLRMVELIPDNPEGYYGLGRAYVLMSDPDRALEPLLRAEEIYVQEGYPEDYIRDTRYHIGMAYYLSYEFVTTQEYLEPLYATAPDDAMLNYALGICYLSPDLYDLERARQHLLRAEELGIDLPPEVEEMIAP